MGEWWQLTLPPLPRCQMSKSHMAALAPSAAQLDWVPALWRDQLPVILFLGGWIGPRPGQHCMLDLAYGPTWHCKSSPWVENLKHHRPASVGFGLNLEAWNLKNYNHNWLWWWQYRAWFLRFALIERGRKGVHCSMFGWAVGAALSGVLDLIWLFYFKGTRSCLLLCWIQLCSEGDKQLYLLSWFA